jgi:hypothetical protein
VDVQALEQAVAQEARGLFSLVQASSSPISSAEEHLGMRVVGRDLDRVERDHAHPRVFELARNQLGQIALDLIGHAEAAVGGAEDFFAGRGLHGARRRITACAPLP